MHTNNEVNVSYNRVNRCWAGRYKGSDGNWKTKTVPVAHGTDEATARVWFARFLSIMAPLGVTAPKPEAPKVKVEKQLETLATVFPLWEAYIEKVRTNKNGDKLNPETASCWAANVRNYALSHEIGKLPLTVESFTSRALLGWVESLKTKGLAKYTLRNIVGALSVMVDDGRKKGWIDLPYNPVSDKIVKSEIPIGETVAGKSNPIHLSKEQAIQLMQSESEGIPSLRKVKNVLALCTGARSSELQGLCWANVDLEHGTLTIERQLVRGGEFPRFGRCKRGSERTVPLHPLAKKALAWWKGQTNPKRTDPVFGNPRKLTEYAEGAAARSFRDDLVSAGLPSQFQGKFPMTQHATRRSFMTLLADAGVPEEASSAMCGHTAKGVRKHYVAAHLERFQAEIVKLPFDNVRLGWTE